MVKKDVFVGIRFPKELVEKIDRHADVNLSTRAQVIREATVKGFSAMKPLSLSKENAK